MEGTAQVEINTILRKLIESSGILETVIHSAKATYKNITNLSLKEAGEKMEDFRALHTKYMPAEIKTDYFSSFAHSLNGYRLDQAAYNSCLKEANIDESVYHDFAGVIAQAETRIGKIIDMKVYLSKMEQYVMHIDIDLKEINNIHYLADSGRELLATLDEKKKAAEAKKAAKISLEKEAAA